MDVSKFRAVNIDFNDGSAMFFHRDRLNEPFRQIAFDKQGRRREKDGVHIDWARDYAHITETLNLGKVTGYE